ncbi:MAG TPA: sulfite exporter TauE/SafE family protein [Ilumatobacter sp.]|nr:sulfite exporter TauE/SafE family protein [Ilumatobacter sp.]
MPDLSVIDHVFAAAAAVGAGAVNALAGGGSLLSFPVLTAIGIPSVSANATNTVALCPGYIGGAYSLRREITASAEDLRRRAVVCGTGGLVGAILLLVTSDSAFRAIVPYLILLSCVLLATQDRVRAWVSGHRTGNMARVESIALFACAAYGGYFGAGLGIMLIAVLGLFSDLDLTRLNALKQPLAAVINVSAAAFLVFSGKVEWSIAAVMAPTSLLGGAAGGRFSARVDARRLRAVVVTIGIAVAVVYLVR